MATVDTPASTVSSDVPSAVVAASVPAPVTEPVPVAAPDPKKMAQKIAKSNGTNYIELDVKSIMTRAGDNIRSGDLPDIEDLAQSIAEEGLIEPIIVTQALDAGGIEIMGKYSVVAGHRRLTAIRSLIAARRYEGTTLTARVITADADRRLKLALIENIQRVDMNPLDKARGLSKLIKSTKLEQQEVAQAIGMAPGYVSQYLALLELPESALNDLRDEKLSFTQARSLCRLLPDVKTIEDLLFEAADLTVAALDAKVSHLVVKAQKAADTATEKAEEDEPGEKKTRTKKAKTPSSEAAVTYYLEAEFRPLKKEEIRDLMVEYKRKELKAEDSAKQEEYRLILKGIALAADLRLK